MLPLSLGGMWQSVTLLVSHVCLIVWSNERVMCRNIKPLFNFDPPATEDEVQAAAVQFVRKVSGMTRPSQANQPAFDQAVDEISVSV